MKVLVTGASGFVGRFLCERLMKDGAQVRGTLLECETESALADGVEPCRIRPLAADTAWSEALAGIDTVIHLAARVHIMDDSASDPLAEFRRVNVDGTAQLAAQAAQLGIARFVFISSIKVNGEETTVPYHADSPPTPSDPYGVSKWEAEQALRQIEAQSGMGVVIIRPTLVYGPGVKANFLNMMKIVQRGIPLPFASIENKRSLVFVGNLVDALTACASHPQAVGQTFLVSDGEYVSTPELLRRTAAALGVPARILPFPIFLMRLAGKLSGKSAVVDRLTGSLVVDSSKIRLQLDWQPPYTMEEGLRETARWFNKEHLGTHRNKN